MDTSIAPMIIRIVPIMRRITRVSFHSENINIARTTVKRQAVQFNGEIIDNGIKQAPNNKMITEKIMIL